MIAIDKMDKNINMSGDFYLADFGYFSMSIYRTHSSIEIKRILIQSLVTD